MAPRVRLVVLNYQGGDDVLRCLDALAALEWPVEDLEVVVVDNGSTDGSREAIVARAGAVRLIANPTNTGFPANNLGLTDLDDIDYVGLVNNDAFVEPGFLAPLVDALAADEGVGAACPKVLLADRHRRYRTRVAAGTRLVGPTGAVAGVGWTTPDSLVDPRPVATAGIAETYVPVAAGPPITEPPSDPAGAEELDLVNNVGNELRPGWFGADRGLHQPDDGRFDEPVDVFAWCGAAVLFPARYIEDVGVFDERLFLYYEDLELAWRGRTRGWRYRTVPTSVVRHRLGASSVVGSDVFRYHVERNRLVVLLELAPLGVALDAAVRHLVATGSYAARDVAGPLLRRRRPAPALTRLRLRAFAGFLRLVPHAVGRRRSIVRRATVPMAGPLEGFRPDRPATEAVPSGRPPRSRRRRRSSPR